MNVYLIEDDWPKRSFLPPILDVLNAFKTREEKPYLDGFAGTGAAAQYDPDRLLTAAEDTNGFCLLDLRLPTDGHQAAANAILQRLRDEKRQQELATYDEIRQRLGESHYQLAVVLLAICKQQKTPVLIVSTAAEAAAVDELTELGFTRVPFPYQPNRDNTTIIEGLAGTIRAVVNPFSRFLLGVEKLSHEDIDVLHRGDELLRGFLMLEPQAFAGVFDTEPVRDALKTISGLTEEGVYQARPLRYNGAWLLALGKYRQCFASAHWRDVFDVRQLACSADNRFPALHPKQASQIIRRGTMQHFWRMCEALFSDKQNASQSVLEKVVLEPRSLSFTLSFPAKDLLKRIALEARSARGEENIEVAHNASRAIWRFWVSCSFGDSPDAKSGVFGNLPRMNVLPKGDQTVVRWAEQE